MNDLQRLAAQVSFGVGVMKASGSIDGDLACVAQRNHLPVGRNLTLHLAHVLPVQKFHDHEQGVRGGTGGRDTTDVDDVDDVGMAQVRSDAGLVEKHRGKLTLLRQVGQDALEHHQLFKAAVAGLFGQENFGHAAVTEPSQQGVFAGNDRRL